VTRAKLAVATGEEVESGPLSEEEIARCQALAQEYLQDTSSEAELAVYGGRRVQECFRALKRATLAAAAAAAAAAAGESQPADTRGSEGGNGGPSQTSAADMGRLQELLRQRDNEISILVAKLRKERALREGDTPATSSTGASAVPRAAPGRSSLVSTGGSGPVVPADRQEAFDRFRRTHAVTPQLNEHKRTLKGLFGHAKAAGEAVNEHRGQINAIKAQIEEHRLDTAVTGLVGGGGTATAQGPGDEDKVGGGMAGDEVEEGLRRRLDGAKQRYKQTLQQLKDLKRQIEHLQHLMGNAKVRAGPCGACVCGAYVVCVWCMWCVCVWGVCVCVCGVCVWCVCGVCGVCVCGECEQTV